MDQLRHYDLVFVAERRKQSKRDATTREKGPAADSSCLGSCARSLHVHGSGELPPPRRYFGLRLRLSLEQWRRRGQRRRFLSGNLHNYPSSRANQEQGDLSADFGFGSAEHALLNGE